MEALCAKTYAGDFEAYGVDFIMGRKYEVNSKINDNEIYVTTESGSDVMLTGDEFKKHLILL